MRKLEKHSEDIRKLSRVSSRIQIVYYKTDPAANYSIQFSIIKKNFAI